MTSDIIIILRNVIILSYLAPLIVFVVLYYFRSPWENTELGIALMFQKLGFSVVMFLAIIGIWFPGYFGRAWIGLVVYTVVMLFLWVDVVNLRRYQRRYPYRRRGREHLNIWQLIKAQIKR